MLELMSRVRSLMSKYSLLLLLTRFSWCVLSFILNEYGKLSKSRSIRERITFHCTWIVLVSLSGSQSVCPRFNFNFATFETLLRSRLFKYTRHCRNDDLFVHIIISKIITYCSRYCHFTWFNLISRSICLKFRCLSVLFALKSISPSIYYHWTWIVVLIKNDICRLSFFVQLVKFSRSILSSNVFSYAWIIPLLFCDSQGHHRQLRSSSLHCNCCQDRSRYH